MSESKPWRMFEVDGRAAVDVERVGWDFRVSRSIQVAHEAGLFAALLDGPLSAEGVATQCATDPDLTNRLLSVVAACGLVFRQPDGQFRLTDTGREAFDPESPLCMNDGLAHARQSWDRWNNMGAQLKHGVKPGRPDPNQHATFVRSMHDYSIRGRAQWLAGNLDLAGRRKLLDLGGGPGTYSIALCERYPELRAVIFDQAPTQPHADEKVALFGLSDRIKFQVGDFTKDDYGTGFDCALLSNVLHGPRYGCEDRLRRTLAAMEPGGLLIVQDFLMDDDRNGPLEAAIFNLHVGAYTLGELIDVITDAGFKQATLRSRGPHGNGLLTAVKG